MHSAATHLNEFVLSAVAIACNIDESVLTLDTYLDEVGLDSLSLMAIIARIEASYGCRFEPQDAIAVFQAERMHDVAAIVQRVMDTR
jgi:acyl carrier protein